MGETEQVVPLRLTYLVKEVNGEWSALCLELDIASCGSSKDDAVESLKGLIALYVEDCREAGEVPIPMRFVPLDALRRFLSPPDEYRDTPFTSHSEMLPVHATA